MTSSPSLLHGTSFLDAAIAEQRARFAAERDDFHDFFDGKTVGGLQKILRTSPQRGPGSKERTELVSDLLVAQRHRPHALWALLLVQAFESLLVRRRRALSRVEDAALDARVVETFVEALDDLPNSRDEETLVRFVVVASAAALKAGRPEGAAKSTLPPVSGLLCADEPSAPTLDAADDARAPEVA
jgi:hypothetical protein